MRWRFRRKGKADLYLPGPFGSIDFRAAYEAAVAGTKAPAPKSRAGYGTLAWLIEEYLRSSKHLNLSDVRRSSIRREMDWLRREAGKYQIGSLAARHVEALMGRKVGPTAANTVKKNLSLLFNFAIKHELAGQKHNPARHADRRKENPDGYHTWTEAEIAQFLAHHGPGTKARTRSSSDPQHCSCPSGLGADGLAECERRADQLPAARTGVGGDYQIMPDLAEELSRIPQDQLLFLTHGEGHPYQPATFGNWFRDQCGAAGLPHCSAHGLRKGLATLIAEGGATELQIMAVLAHATPKEGSTYVKKANRGRLADQGLALSVGMNGERVRPTLLVRLDKRSKNGE